MLGAGVGGTEAAGVTGADGAGTTGAAEAIPGVGEVGLLLSESACPLFADRAACIIIKACEDESPSPSSPFSAMRSKAETSSGLIAADNGAGCAAVGGAGGTGCGKNIVCGVGIIGCCVGAVGAVAGTTADGWDTWVIAKAGAHVASATSGAGCCCCCCCVATVKADEADAGVTIAAGWCDTSGTVAKGAGRTPAVARGAGAVAAGCCGTSGCT